MANRNRTRPDRRFLNLPDRRSSAQTEVRDWNSVEATSNKGCSYLEHRSSWKESQMVSTRGHPLADISIHAEKETSVPGSTVSEKDESPAKITVNTHMFSTPSVLSPHDLATKIGATTLA